MEATGKCTQFGIVNDSYTALPLSFSFLGNNSSFWATWKLGPFHYIHCTNVFGCISRKLKWNILHSNAYNGGYATENKGRVFEHIVQVIIDLFHAIKRTWPFGLFTKLTTILYDAACTLSVAW